MIDSHFHFSYHYFNQTFPYITVENDVYVIKYGSRESLTDEMKDAGIICCIEPAIDADPNERLLKLIQKYLGIIYIQQSEIIRQDHSWNIFIWKLIGCL